MISRDDFLAAVKQEYATIAHLVGCVPATGWDYRPTPAQRSTRELLAYLSHSATSVLGYALDGTWEAWEANEAKAKQLDVPQAVAALARQPAAIAKRLRTLTPARLKKPIKDMSGKRASLASFLQRWVLGGLVAYRMQLFLYAKAAGNSGIGSSDCWMGKPAPKEKAAKA